MRLFLIILLGVCCFPALAQSIQNVKATFLEGKVVVTYDLVGGKPDQKFALDLYGSHNNFSTPLTKVSGDAGKNITPGIGKKIIWEAAQEFSTYRKDITFKVKGEAMALPFLFKTPVADASLRRGKKTKVKWEGGKPSQSVKLELYQGDKLIITVAETSNTGQYTWSIPKKQSKGSYTLKLSTTPPSGLPAGQAGAGGSETANSNAFKIKSKTPFLVKILPVAAVGGVLAFLAGGGGSGSNDLPEAPGPK